MTTKLKTTCPHCEKRLRIDEAKRGKTVRCPACGEAVVVEDSVQTSGAVSGHISSPTSVDTAELADAETVGDMADRAMTDLQKSTIGTLGRFELKALLGAGGFGKVYRAYDPQLDRDIALKVPLFDSAHKTRRKRFLVEAKAAARLKHANIVSTFESGKDGNRYYIASEFIDGKLLSEHIKDTKLSPIEAARIARKMADALEYAHSRNIVHRDLKPHNIILDENDEPQLMDFGLAKRVDEDSTMTTDGMLLGTPAYMSPEQARGELSTVDAASDQYSLGVVLFHMLTGTTPVAGSPHVVVAEVAKGKEYSPRYHTSEIDQDLNAICRKAMCPDRDGRYASCSDFAADLQAWLELRPVRARIPTRKEEISRLFKQHRTTFLTAGAFVAVLCVATVVSLWFAFKAVKAQAEAEAFAIEVQQKERLAEGFEEQATAFEQSSVSFSRRARSAESRAKSASAKALEAEKRLRSTEAEIRAAEQELNAATTAAQSELANAKREAIDAQSELAASDAQRLYLQALHIGASGRQFQALQLLYSIPEEHRRVEWRLAVQEFEQSLFGKDSEIEDQVRKQLSDKGPDSLRSAASKSSRKSRTLRVSIRSSPPGTMIDLGGKAEKIVCSWTGDTIAIALAHGDVEIWDVRTGVRRSVVSVSQRAQTALALHADGSQLALPRFSEGVVLYDTSTGVEVGRLGSGSDTGFADCIEYSPNGQFMAMTFSHRQKRRLTVWDLQRKERLWEKEDRCTTLEFSRDSSALLCSSPGSNGVSCADARTGRNLWWRSANDRARKTRNPLKAFCRSPSGSYLATADENILVWDKDMLNLKNDRRASIPSPIIDWSRRIAFSSDEQRLLILDTAGVEIWDWKHHSEVYQIPAQGPVAVSGNGQLAFLSVLDGAAIKVVDLEYESPLSDPGEGLPFNVQIHYKQPGYYNDWKQGAVAASGRWRPRRSASPLNFSYSQGGIVCSELACDIGPVDWSRSTFNAVDPERTTRKIEVGRLYKLERPDGGIVFHITLDEH